MRSALILTLLLGLIASVPGLRAQSGEKKERRRSGDDELEYRANRAVTNGLRYLARSQNRDGSWTDRIGRKVHNSYEGIEGEHVGVTALACMAFLANGSLPGRGPYAENIERGLEFVLDSVQPNGFISNNESRMYSHAFATLFLAEVYGMTGMDRVRDRLKSSVDLIVTAQNEQGGWRYQPGAQDADMSIVVCQVMALRAARNAGIHVPKVTIDSAIDYVRNSFDSYDGSYFYQYFPGNPRHRRYSRTSFALTAAGVTALYGAGEYEGIHIEKGIRYLRRHTPSGRSAENRFDYFYGVYYATQAFFQKGGSDWDNWWSQIRLDLVRIQDRSNGSWTDLVGPNYATAMACVILQIPYQYLPIFER